MEMRDLDIISPLGVLANRLGFRVNHTHIQRIPTSPSAATPPASSHSNSSHESSMERNSRHSMQWPFRGSTHMYSNSSASYNTGRTRSNTGNTGHTHSNSSNFNSTISSFWARRGTWASRGHRHNASSMSDLDIIPDYVVNYIRGETPETLAVKREMRRGPQNVRIQRHSRGFHSRTANFFMSASEESNDAASLAYSEDEKDLEPMGWSSGWRAGALLNLGLSLVLLILIMVAFIAAVSRTSSLVGQSAIFTGSCHSAQNLSYGLHIIVSVIVIAIVVVGNYLFQVLSSPTRAEVTVAHEKRQWMDLGIPSIRNLLHISSNRIVYIAVLLLTAFTAQVFYNAILFTAHSAGAYNMALMSSDFFTGASFNVDSDTNNAGNLSTSALADLQQNLDDYVNMTVPDCARAFSSSFSPFDVLLLVTDDKDSDADALLQTATAGTQLFGFAQTVSTSQIIVQNHPVAYCLAHSSQAEQTCSVMINSSFVAASALITLFSTLVIGAIILTMAKFCPLATLGDALNSFLDMPDSSTYDSCLMSKDDVKEGRWGLHEPKHWNPKEHYWLMTPSMLRWAGWAVMWLVPTILAIVALALGIQNNPLKAMSDFGLPAPNQIFFLPSGASAAGVSLIVGLPHLLLAALYMCTNALMTTYFFSHELSLFAVASQPRALRISSGVLRGSQKSSLYITLPRAWSWVLFFFFASLSFIASQAIFAVSMATGTAPLSGSSTIKYISAVGISGAGMLTLIALLMLLAGLVVGLGLRRADPSPSTVEGFPAGNPLVLRGGSCSAVISARCHSSGQGEVTSRPMAWGVVQEGEGMTVGHAAFSAREVWALNKGRVYA